MPPTSTPRRGAGPSCMGGSKRHSRRPVAIPTAEAAGLAVELLNTLREAGGQGDDASRVRVASLPTLAVRGTTGPVHDRAPRRAGRARRT